MDDQVKTIVSSLIPVVTQGVVASLKELGMISGGASTQANPSQQPANDATTKQHTQTETEKSPDQQLQVSNILVINPLNGSNDTASNTANNSANESTVLNSGKAASISRPLALGFDEKIKGKIWANQFIEFKSLLQNNESEKIEIVEDSHGVLTCKKTKSGSIKTVDSWFETFRNFTAIYTAKCPADTHLRMKYADTVQRLGKHAGGAAALYYDKQFRLWRQDTPELLPWNQLNSESFHQALAMGLVTKSKGKFGTQRKKKQQKQKKKKKKKRNKKKTKTKTNNNNKKTTTKKTKKQKTSTKNKQTKKKKKKKKWTKKAILILIQ